MNRLQPGRRQLRRFLGINRSLARLASGDGRGLDTALPARGLRDPGCSLRGGTGRLAHVAFLARGLTDLIGR